MIALGSVRSLHRYPVKSMQGEALSAAVVSERGLGGDRTHALLDVATGKIASAKRPRLWRKLLLCRASAGTDAAAGATPDGVRILLPDGAAVRVTDTGIDQLMSSLLQRPVRLIADVPDDAGVERADAEGVLARGVDSDVSCSEFKLGQVAPRTTFADYGPVHLVTTSTLAELSRSAGHEIEALRYRPNVLIDTPGLPPFNENQWVGRTLTLGASVQLKVVLATPRCAIPTLQHGDLPNRPEALLAVLRLNRVEFAPGISLPCVGVHAKVLTGGIVRCGNDVRLSDNDVAASD